MNPDVYGSNMIKLNHKAFIILKDEPFIDRIIDFYVNKLI